MKERPHNTIYTTPTHTGHRQELQYWTSPGESTYTHRRSTPHRSTPHCGTDTDRSPSGVLTRTRDTCERRALSAQTLEWLATSVCIQCDTWDKLDLIRQPEAVRTTSIKQHAWRRESSTAPSTIIDAERLRALRALGPCRPWPIVRPPHPPLLQRHPTLPLSLTHTVSLTLTLSHAYASHLSHCSSFCTTQTCTSPQEAL